MTPLDKEMAGLLKDICKRMASSWCWAVGQRFHQAADGSLEVLTRSGKIYPADLVVLGIGVRPETWLAKDAGIEIGERGGIRVDDQMRTKFPIYSQSATQWRSRTLLPSSGLW